MSRLLLLIFVSAACLTVVPQAEADPCVLSGQYCVTVRPTCGSPLGCWALEACLQESADYTCAGAAGVCTYTYNSNWGGSDIYCEVSLWRNGHNACVFHRYPDYYPSLYSEEYIACV